MLCLGSAETFCLRIHINQVRIPEFKNVSRVIIMPVIIASGYIGRPLFIFKGTRLQHRTVERDGVCFLESLADCMPRKSIVTREELAGVDKSNFAGWAEIFVEDVGDLAANNKVLLLYEG